MSSNLNNLIEEKKADFKEKCGMDYWEYMGDYLEQYLKDVVYKTLEAVELKYKTGMPETVGSNITVSEKGLTNKFKIN